MKGRTHSEEIRRKMSPTNNGKHSRPKELLSWEIKRKMSVAHKVQNGYLER
jgi:hypothetical protein